MPPSRPRLFVRCWVPSDASGDGEYTPWVLGHADETALSDERLNLLARQYADGGGLDGYLDPDAFDTWLEAEHGYVSFWVAGHAGMFMLDTSGWEELEDALGPDDTRPISPGLTGPSTAGLDRAIATAWAVRQAADATLVERTLQRIARQVAAAAPTAARLHFCVRHADEPGHLDGLGVARLTDQTGAEVHPPAADGGLEELLLNLEKQLLEELATLAGVADVDPQRQVLDLTFEPPVLVAAEQAAEHVD
jgi:hypothetical protein